MDDGWMRLESCGGGCEIIGSVVVWMFGCRSPENCVRNFGRTPPSAMPAYASRRQATGSCGALVFPSRCVEGAHALDGMS